MIVKEDVNKKSVWLSTFHTFKISVNNRFKVQYTILAVMLVIDIVVIGYLIIKVN